MQVDIFIDYPVAALWLPVSPSFKREIKMDPQTLPTYERSLYNTIKDRYTVAFEPLKIREHKLQLLKITDLEQILEGKDPLKDVSTFPFWIRLWEAAIVLSEFIAGLPHEKETTLMELGAGFRVGAGITKPRPGAYGGGRQAQQIVETNVPVRPRQNTSSK